MKRFITSRILLTIPTILGVLIATFLIIRLIPGDPAVLYLGETATEEQLNVFREEHGLNEPMVVQIGITLRNFAKGDLGVSIGSRRPVLDMILENFTHTLKLAFAGITFAVICGLIFGIISAVGRGSWADLTIVGFSTIFMSMPAFLWALILMMIFGVKLGWIPIISIGSGGLNIKSLIAPALSLGLGGAALFTRTVRSSFLEVLGEDYIRTARAKGLSERTVLLKHVLKAAIMPVVTIVCFYFATYLGGAVVIETIFARPGIGSMLIEALYARDYAVVQGTTVFISLIMIAVNLITDILYGVLNPQVQAPSVDM